MRCCRSYEAAVVGFCDRLQEINSRLDFQVSSRGWCYLLEEHGLRKGDFDAAQNLIVECRRQRLLPMDIVAEDGARSFDHLEELHGEPEEYAYSVVRWISESHTSYLPFSFWD